MRAAYHPSFFLFLGAMFALLVLGGCRRATEQDCERIIDRIVELELEQQGIDDPELVAQRKQAAQQAKREELLAGCVGKRISKSALECIDNAQTPEEITDKCLR